MSIKAIQMKIVNSNKFNEVYVEALKIINIQNSPDVGIIFFLCRTFLYVFKFVENGTIYFFKIGNTSPLKASKEELLKPILIPF